MFEYKLRFQNTTTHANTNALSHLPLPVEPSVKRPPPEVVLLVDHLDNSPITAHQIPVVQFVQQGWPNVCPDSAKLAPFFEKRMELSIYEGCLLWGTRIIVPTACRGVVLTEFHEEHPGVTRMKGLAKMYVWWSGITKDIEQAVQQCSACQMHRSTLSVAPLHLWSWPTRPWAYLHLDYAGPVQGKMILILIDTHSSSVSRI